MFQTDLLSIRRDRKRGRVAPIFIGEDTEDYAAMVKDLFREMIGERRYAIQNKIKELELKVEHNKVIKGLAELMFRECKFSSSQKFNPPELRERLFLESRNGAAREKDRENVIRKISLEFKATVQEIEESIYADKEDEALLLEVPPISEEYLRKLYNLEQAETLILKSSFITISDVVKWSDIVLRIKRLGLFFTPQLNEGAVNSIKVDGPVSILEGSRRYSSKLALLIRALMHSDQWSMEAEVTIKQDRKNELFTFILTSSSKYLFPSAATLTENPHPDWLAIADPVVINGTAYFPDFYSQMDGSTIYVDISRPEYKDYNEMMSKAFLNAGIPLQIAYKIGKKDRFKSSEPVYREKVDYEDLLKRIRKNLERTDYKTDKPEHTSAVKHHGGALTDSLIARVNAAWPDTAEMIELLESNGLDAETALKSLGYSVRWEGLGLRVTQRNF